MAGCRTSISEIRNLKILEKSIPSVLMYSTQICPYCVMAEKFLQKKGVDHLEKILIDRDPAQRELMMTRTGRRTVPQIYIGDTHVGGYDDLIALDRAGQLDALLT